MRGKQRATADHIVNVLGHRPGNRKAVKGGGATANLVENDQRAVAGMVEDEGGLTHLHHERGLAARQVVGGADSAENPIHYTYSSCFRRDEGADLRHHGDERDLADVGRLAGHVRSC